MVKVSPDQVTLVGAGGPSATEDLVVRDDLAVPEDAVDLRDLELVLLELIQRAPAPVVGPSHWWG